MSLTNTSPRDAVIVDYARTPMGRSKQGCFRHLRADRLSAELLTALLARNPKLEPEMIDDLIWGCVMQREEQGFNIARNIILSAGLPHSITGQTINRLCGSSMSALHIATANIRAGLGDVYCIGGVEHMGHINMNEAVDPDPLWGLSVAKAAGSMGITAEYLAQIHNISREAMDRFAVRSHTLAHAARSSGVFEQEIIPIVGHNEEGAMSLISEDETIRPETNLETLSQLKPVFDPANGLITAASSSQVSDGASAMLVMSAEKAASLNLAPQARIVSLGLAGVDPSIMGIGPVPASEKALKAAGLSYEDIDLIELNEAFAAQALAVLKVMGLDETTIDTKVNLHGGAIALGHPFGCSGARITGSLLNSLQKNNQQWGLATMCIGLGQGIATIIERL